ncbi:sigma factor-like helix-turn-helix DNA-binding protein [Streptomyces sp. NPDC101181]|uniref:sigma factor-like helix-turn-helix DNA-binding protein n=1 Tax=Streptomyces sp. NPDC101181 TaxID=3366125 RepID=UPI0037FD3235
MTRTARRRLRAANVPTSVVEADDIVSSAFAKALQNPGEVRRPVPYVYALIRTEVQHLATRRNEHICLDRKRAADPVDSPAPYVADFSTLVDNRDAVHRAVSVLPAPQQTAVWATHALGYTREETAVLMGRHPGTVARHTTRGMAALRACFAAVFAAMVSTVGLVVGGRLQDAGPVGHPRTDPAPPSDLWWALPLIIALGAVSIAVCASIVFRVLARRLKAPSPHVEEPPPNVVMLCANCHQLLDTHGADLEQHRAILSRAHHTTEEAREAAGSACQLCGHEPIPDLLLEAAHIIPIQRGGSAPSNLFPVHGGHFVRRTIRDSRWNDGSVGSTGRKRRVIERHGGSTAAEQSTEPTAGAALAADEAVRS